MTITPSHIIQYLYCPRFTYFEYVARIPQYEEKFFKVLKGRKIHEQKARQNIEYLRKKSELFVNILINTLQILF